MATRITGRQIKDDSLTGDDIDESTLVISLDDVCSVSATTTNDLRLANIMPDSGSTYDIGDPTTTWRAIYADNLYAGGTNITTVVNSMSVPGADGEVIFNNNGSFGSTSLFSIDAQTNHVSIGTGQTRSTLQVHDAAAPNPLSDLGNPSVYQLGISGSGNSSNGLGIAFGDLTNVGASIVFDDQGTNAKGSLRFYTKNSTNSGDAPLEAMAIRYDGNVGVGVSNPQSAFEVAPSIGLSNSSTDAGTFNFSVNTNTPAANSTLGTINFGSISYKNAYIETVNPTAWRLFSNNGGNHHQEMNFYATAQDGWNAELIVNMNADTGVVIEKGLDVTLDANFNADVRVLGDISAVNGVFSGSVSATNGYSTSTGSYTTTSGNITTTSGSVIGSRITSTGDVLATGGTVSAQDVTASANVIAAGTVEGGTVSSNSDVVASGNFVTATGDVSATGGSVRGAFLYGDGSNITNLPLTPPGGSTSQLQYNEGGVFRGANIRQSASTGQLSVGTSADYSGYLTVSRNYGTNPNTNPHIFSNNHLVVKFDGSAQQAEGAAIAFADDTGITGNISSYVLANSSNAVGGLMFRTKNNTTLNGSLDNAMFLSPNNIVNYYPTTTMQTLTSNGLITGYQGILSSNTTYDPNESGGDYQFMAVGADNKSAGISFGNSSDAGAGIVAEPTTNDLSVADLKFKTRQSVSDGLNTKMTITNTGNVGIGIDPPAYKLHVDGTVTGAQLTARHASLPMLYLSQTTNPMNADIHGEIRSNNQAGIKFGATENWDSNGKGTSVQIYGTPRNSTVTSNLAYFADDLSAIYTPLSITGTLTTSVLNANGAATFNVGITETSTLGIAVTNSSASVTSPSISSNYYYTNAVAKSYGTEFLYTNYSETPSGFPNGYSDVSFKNIDDWSIFNRDNSRYIVRIKNTTSTSTIANERGKLFLTSNTLAASSSYHLSNLSNGHGLYVEGSSSGSGELVTAAATIVNVTGSENSDGTLKGATNGDSSSRTDQQSGLDLIVGKGATLGSNSIDFPTANTKFARFISPVYKINSGVGSYNGIDYNLYAKTQSGNELNPPVVIGRIRGNSYGGVTYHTSFTGAHGTVIKKSESLELGMIVSSTGEIWVKGAMETALPKTTVSSKPKDKTVFGVICTLQGEHAGYCMVSPLAEDEQHIEVNALGEGEILLTNFSGNIENGDYITTGPIPGLGVLQDDDLLHSYTVAKCTESIDWDAVTDTVEFEGQTYKKYLAACTYHCG